MVSIIAIIFSCYSFFLWTVTNGDLVLEKNPVCPGDSAVYRCNVTSWRLEWIWGSVESLTVLSGLTVPGTRSRIIEGTTVVFNVTNLGPSYISVLATVTDPETLNGTRMVCNDQILDIIFIQTNILTATLSVTHNESASIVEVYPNVDGDISSISYQRSEMDALMAVAVPILLDVPGIIQLFHCRNNITFTIDPCILQDNNENRHYTVYSNSTWVISQRCIPSEIQLTCSNGSWSEDISCQELDTTGPDNSRTTETQEVMATTGSDKINECRRYGEIIGTTIGSFVVALILGIVLGLLCGVKYKSVKSEKLSKTSLQDLSETKRPLYDDIEINKQVEMSPNVSYDVVKRPN